MNPMLAPFLISTFLWNLVFMVLSIQQVKLLYKHLKIDKPTKNSLILVSIFCPIVGFLTTYSRSRKFQGIV
jgi:hypothetical protein